MKVEAQVDMLSLRRDSAREAIVGFLGSRELLSPREQIVTHFADTMLAKGRFLLLDAEIRDRRNEIKSTQRIVYDEADLRLQEEHAQAQTEWKKYLGVIESHANPIDNLASKEAKHYKTESKVFEGKVKDLLMAETEKVIDENVDSSRVDGIVCLRVGTILNEIRTDALQKQFTKTAY